MGQNFSDNITVDGSTGAKNLLALMLPKGFQGPAVVGQEGTLFNPSTTVPAYIFFTDSNINAPGTKQAQSTPVVGTITGAGAATFTITAAGLTGSPLAVSVPNLTIGMTARDVAAAAVLALNGNVAVSALFDISLDYGPAKVIMTKKAPAANDGTFNIAYTNGTCTGLTPDPTSDVVSAGSLYTTQGMPIEVATGIPSGVFTLHQGTDLSTTWLYTASSIALACEVQN